MFKKKTTNSLHCHTQQRSAFIVNCRVLKLWSGLVWSPNGRSNRRSPSPVVGEQAVAEDEPPPLVALQVVGPFKEPAFVRVQTREVQPGESRGGKTLHQLVHLPLSGR